MTLSEAIKKCRANINKALEEGNLQEAKMWKSFAEQAEVLKTILESEGVDK